MRTIIFACLSLFSFSASAVENHTASVPSGADLARFPIVETKAKPADAVAEYVLEAQLGLRPVVLEKPIKAFNHYRTDNSWRYEEISKGAMVFVDTHNVVRYKADCWNRLVVIPSWYDALLEWIRGVASGLGDSLMSGSGRELILVILATLIGVLIGRRMRR